VVFVTSDPMGPVSLRALDGTELAVLPGGEFFSRILRVSTSASGDLVLRELVVGDVGRLASTINLRDAGDSCGWSAHSGTAGSLRGVLSPDGLHLLVRTTGQLFSGQDRRDPLEAGLYLVDARRPSGPWQLLRPGVGASALAWHPDGRTAVVAVGGSAGDADLVTVDLDGTTRPLLVGPEDDMGAAWSPDGARLAVLRRQQVLDTTQVSLLVGGADGQDTRTLLVGSLLSQPTWTPDGREVLIGVHDHEAVTDQILAVDVVTGAVRLFSPGRGATVGFQPDGIVPGYVIASADAGTYAVGTCPSVVRSPVVPIDAVGVGVAQSPEGERWVATAGGSVLHDYRQPVLGDLSALPGGPAQPVVGIAAMPVGRGYWLVAADGGVFPFGDAGFLGSLGAVPLNRPIVGMAPTPSGGGYWLVAADGGVFAFGDAAFHGSLGSVTLHQPIVGMAATASGDGYWLVAADGGVFTFGDAVFRGSTGAVLLNRPLVGMAATPSGDGYWLAAADGGVFTFGDAAFRGAVNDVPGLTAVGITAG
jgi:hypothetical protein